MTKLVDVADLKFAGIAVPVRIRLLGPNFNTSVV